MYNVAMNCRLGSSLIAFLTIVLPWGPAAFADYTLVLKNGRRITVDAYREEGNTIKFFGIGGEIGIGKDQIQTILKGGEGEGRGLSLSRPAVPQAEPTEGSQEERKSPQAQRAEARSEAAAPPSTGDESAPPELSPADRAAQEEQDYQRKVRDVTEQLRAAEQRYRSASRGDSSPDPGLLTGDEAIRARADDLNSRLRDQQHNPGGPADAGGVKLANPSPFTGQPPVTTELRPGEVVPRVEPPVPSYTEKERELSELRGQVNELVKERQRLIEEMRQKNMQSGDLFQ